MIKPYVITKSQVKTYLGITDSTYDTQIDLYIPEVTDNLTRKNGICNQDFLLNGIADTAGTVTMSNVSIDWDKLYIGSCIYINGEDGVIASFSEDDKTITLSESLTESELDQELIVRNFPVGAKKHAAKMVWYDTTGTTTAISKGDIKSKSIGGLSVSFNTSDGESIDSRFGYPESLMKALNTVRRKRFL